MLPVCGFDSEVAQPGLQLRALPPTLPAGGMWEESQGDKRKWGQKSFQCTSFLNYTHTPKFKTDKWLGGDWERKDRK